MPNVCDDNFGSNSELASLDKNHLLVALNPTTLTHSNLRGVIAEQAVSLPILSLWLKILALCVNAYLSHVTTWKRTGGGEKYRNYEIEKYNF